MVESLPCSISVPCLSRAAALCKAPQGAKQPGSHLRLPARSRERSGSQGCAEDPPAWGLPRWGAGWVPLAAGCSPTRGRGKRQPARELGEALRHWDAGHGASHQQRQRWDPRVLTLPLPCPPHIPGHPQVLPPPHRSQGSPSRAPLCPGAAHAPWVLRDPQWDEAKPKPQPAASTCSLNTQNLKYSLCESLAQVTHGSARSARHCKVYCIHIFCNSQLAAKVTSVLNRLQSLVRSSK